MSERWRVSRVLCTDFGCQLPPSHWVENPHMGIVFGRLGPFCGPHARHMAQRLNKGVFAGNPEEGHLAVDPASSHNAPSGHVPEEE